MPEARGGSQEDQPHVQGVVAARAGGPSRGTLWGRIKGAKYRFDLQFLTWDFS